MLMMCPSDVHTTRLYTCLGSLVEFFCALMHNHGATSYNVAHVPALEKTMFRKKTVMDFHMGCWLPGDSTITYYNYVSFFNHNYLG